MSSSSTAFLSKAVTVELRLPSAAHRSSSFHHRFRHPSPDFCRPLSLQHSGKLKLGLRPDGAFEKRRGRFCCKSQLGELAPVTSAVYGSLLLCGGLFAFGRSGSKGSLAGGCTGAVLMGAAYYLMQASETQQIGYALGFGSAFLFASVFGLRLAATRKLAPAGPLLGLSVLALVVFVSAYLQDTV